MLTLKTVSWLKCIMFDYLFHSLLIQRMMQKFASGLFGTTSPGLCALSFAFICCLGGVSSVCGIC